MCRPLNCLPAFHFLQGDAPASRIARISRVAATGCSQGRKSLDPIAQFHRLSLVEATGTSRRLSALRDYDESIARIFPGAHAAGLQPIVATRLPLQTSPHTFPIAEPARVPICPAPNDGNRSAESTPTTELANSASRPRRLRPSPIGRGLGLGTLSISSAFHSPSSPSSRRLTPLP